MREDEGIIIYQRFLRDQYKWQDIKKYFEFNKKRNEATGNEFKIITQVRAYLKKCFKIDKNDKKFLY